MDIINTDLFSLCSGTVTGMLLFVLCVVVLIVKEVSCLILLVDIIHGYRH